jgi:hypothetical protein
MCLRGCGPKRRSRRWLGREMPEGTRPVAAGGRRPAAGCGCEVQCPGGRGRLPPVCRNCSVCRAVTAGIPRRVCRRGGGLAAGGRWGASGVGACRTWPARNAVRPDSAGHCRNPASPAEAGRGPTEAGRGRQRADRGRQRAEGRQRPAKGRQRPAERRQSGAWANCPSLGSLGAHTRGRRRVCVVAGNSGSRERD